jgi:hypothetical protein
VVWEEEVVEKEEEVEDDEEEVALKEDVWAVAVEVEVVE